MAEKNWPHTNQLKFVAFTDIIKAFLLIFVWNCILNGQNAEGISKTLPDSRGSYLSGFRRDKNFTDFDTHHNHPSIVPSAINKLFDYGYQTNFSTSHRRKKSGRRKRIKDKRHRSNSMGFWNGSNWYERSPKLPRGDTRVLGSSIIQVGNDSERQGMLIQKVMTDSKPEIRYYQNYNPYHWRDGRWQSHNRLTTTGKPATGRIYILPSLPKRGHQSKKPHHERNNERHHQHRKNSGASRQKFNYLNGKKLKCSKLPPLSPILKFLQY